MQLNHDGFIQGNGKRMGKIIELRYGPVLSTLHTWQSVGTADWEKVNGQAVLMVTFCTVGPH